MENASHVIEVILPQATDGLILNRDPLQGDDFPVKSDAKEAFTASGMQILVNNIDIGIITKGITIMRWHSQLQVFQSSLETGC